MLLFKSMKLYLFAYVLRVFINVFVFFFSSVLFGSRESEKIKLLYVIWLGRKIDGKGSWRKLGCVWFERSVRIR